MTATMTIPFMTPRAGSGDRSAVLRRAVALLTVVAGLGGASMPALAQLPSPTVTLSSLGVGTSGDATAALQRALNSGSGRCLDGEGRTYVTSRTLEARGDLCLVDANIVFRAPAPQTRSLVGGRCDAGANPARRIDCGDRVLGGDAGRSLVDYAYRRTLFVSAGSGAAPAVTLVDVRIDRGNDPRSGSRSDSAALWIDGARQVRLDNVEITGSGKGHGLFVSNSRNVETSGLNVHDMVWAPYDGDTPLDVNEIRALGWNRPTIREIEVTGRSQARFVGARVQEQLSCVTFVATRHIVMRDTTVENCGARFRDGVLPWQADGINLGSGTSDVRILGNTRIARTWEGIDIVGSGSGVQDVVIDGARVSDSFSIGVKLGNRTSSAVLRNSTIDGAGLTGVMIYGPADAIRLANVAISGVGDDGRDAAGRRQWTGEKAGVMIDRDGNGASPQAVSFDAVTVSGGNSCAAGVRYSGGSTPSSRALTVRGCAQTLRQR